MSLITIRQLLTILLSVLGSVFAFMNYIRKRQDNRKHNVSKEDSRTSNTEKVVLGLILCVVVSYVGLSAYLELVNRDQIIANLRISVADPVVVNKNGRQTDSFVADADFLVVSYNTKFIIDATITLENVDTWEQYTYHPISNEGYFTIADIKSGKYHITVFSGSEKLYEDIVLLNRSNVLSTVGKDIWDFTAFTLNDFESKAKKHTISLGNSQEGIEYPVFTIDTEKCDTVLCFASEIDQQNNGQLAGTFLFLPGQYVLNNAVTGATMPPLSFDID